MRAELVTILIPAAGASRRMGGRDKLLETVEGMPLLARAAAVACQTGARVVVTVPPGPRGRARRSALARCGVTILTVPDADEGMAASLRAGAAAAEQSHALMILLPDLPELETPDLSAMIEAFTDEPHPVLRATAEDGTPGHPVILASRLFPALARLHGDEGARAIIAGEAVQTFALPGARATTDLDTPEAWAAWRAGRKD